MSQTDTDPRSLSDGALWAAYQEAHREASSAADDEDWTSYQALSENEDRYTSELDRRSEARSAPTRTAPVARAVAQTAQQRIAQVKADLATAEASFTKVASATRPNPDTAPRPGEVEAHQAKEEAFLQRGRLQNELAVLEARTQFLDLDDQAFNLQAEEAEIGMEEATAVLNAIPESVRASAPEHKPASLRRAERLVAEARERLAPLQAEAKIRSLERQREIGLTQLVERKALGLREKNLRDWTAERDRLVEATKYRPGWRPAHVADQIQALRVAERQVHALEQAIKTSRPVTPSEVDGIRARLDQEAPRPIGSWKR